MRGLNWLRIHDKQVVSKEWVSVELLAPIRNPQHLFAIGLNYADHIAETKLARPAHHCGTVDTIEVPKASSQVEYEVEVEVELVAVIGKRGRHITRNAAADYVLEICVGTVQGS